MTLRGDPEFRAEMEAFSAKRGAEYVHDLLKERDPEAARAIHPNNKRRVIRALEILHTTGIPVVCRISSALMTLRLLFG